MAAILREEALLIDLLQDLNSDRGFTTPFLQSQWEKQKTLQLSVQACMSVCDLVFGVDLCYYTLDNDQAGMKKFAKLLEAERSAQAHSDALDAVKKELDRISLARTLSHSPVDLKEHFQAAQRVRSLHDESQERLHDLTAQIGLSDLKLLRNPSSAERDYIEKYILARFRKHAILIRLAKYQDEMNPIRSSQRRGGRLVAKVGKHTPFEAKGDVLESSSSTFRIL
jgi:hypothetical protein